MTKFVVTFYVRPPSMKEFSTSFTTREYANCFVRETLKRHPRWTYRIDEEPV